MTVSPYLFFSTIGPNLSYEWITYQEVFDRSRRFGCGLVANGIKPKQFIGVFSRNCPEYVVMQQACCMFSMVPVTLYDTLGEDGILHILNEAELEVVVCGADKLPLLFSLANQTKHLRRIIKIGDVTKDEHAKAESMNIKLVPMDQVLSDGEKNPCDAMLPTPDDLFIICYTSGTTGKPKGVMLTHRNMAAQLAGMIPQMADHDPMGPHSLHMCYLPLAHMMEQTTHALIWVHGAAMGFSRGDPKLLLEDLQALKPTVFPTVPRILNRVYDRVLNGVNQSGFVKRFLFNTGLSWKTSYLQQGIITQNTFWDWLVFSKIRAFLGGRVSLIVTGSAPVSAEVLAFWRCVFGCALIEGYGQSEVVAGSNLTTAGDTRGGNVGPPLASVAIKLVGIPEMNYLAENGEGEVCFSGPSVFKGYLKNEEKTRETIDEDGWVHSGDIGRWNPDGTLSIIDRKKHIFKLAQGEYLAPERIETICMRAPMVGQIFVDGDSLQPWCVAVVVPDEDVLPRWARQNGLSSDMVELCRDEKAVKAVLEQVEQACKEGGLKSFEIPKAVLLHPEQFTPENGLVTPTLKKKRPQIRAHFKSRVAELYESLSKKN